MGNCPTLSGGQLLLLPPWNLSRNNGPIWDSEEKWDLISSQGFLILLFTWVWWVEHFGITSRLCLAIRSKSWLTRKEGGKAETPPLGMVINSRHIGQRNCPVSRAKVATIRSRQWRQTVCEQGNNLGLCSTPSYIPVHGVKKSISISGFCSLRSLSLTFRASKGSRK